MEREKNILLSIKYNGNGEDENREYTRYIKREQHFLKHLIFRAICNNPSNENIKVLVYIHAGFGERTEKDYHFSKKDSKGYKALIQTDDWSDIGGVEEFKDFFYNYNIPL